MKDNDIMFNALKSYTEMDEQGQFSGVQYSSRVTSREYLRVH